MISSSYSSSSRLRRVGVVSAIGDPVAAPHLRRPLAEQVTHLEPGHRVRRRRIQHGLDADLGARGPVPGLEVVAPVDLVDREGLDPLGYCVQRLGLPFVVLVLLQVPVRLADGEEVAVEYGIVESAAQVLGDAVRPDGGVGQVVAEVHPSAAAAAAAAATATAARAAARLAGPGGPVVGQAHRSLPFHRRLAGAAVGVPHVGAQADPRP